MIIVSNIKLDINSTKQQAIQKALGKINLDIKNVKAAFVHKMSVDARKDVKFVYSIGINLNDKNQEIQIAKKYKNVVVKQQSKLLIQQGDKKLSTPPVICGFGPAGLFCALVLARQGFNPIIIEQGQSVDGRTKSIKDFEKNAKLNTRSNIQFGEGGAGTFSDGKLTTRIGDERCDFVTNTFVEFGAPENIKYMAKPHIGTDLLVGIIKNIRNEIINLGGQVLFDTKLTNIRVKNNRITSIQTENGTIQTDVLILATGHSSRDTFFILKENGLNMQAKPFSVGVRIESLQKDIDRGLYHSLAGHSALPIGEYQLSHHVAGRGVYTFCMCPGGNVVAAASEYDTVVVNGMSYHSRNGKNANSAVVVSVTPDDFAGDFRKGIEFQRKLERTAFDITGKNYTAPAQTVENFLNGKKGASISRVDPTYPIGITDCDLNHIFPHHISKCLKDGLVAMSRKLNGFAMPDNILTGVETRTSSPVRIVRNDIFQSNIAGVYPCGEGAGYAGGIMSAAVDGIRVAQQICREYKIGI